MNLPEVKAALHVKADINWVICSDTLRYTKNLGSNSYTFYPELVSRYRVRPPLARRRPSCRRRHLRTR